MFAIAVSLVQVSLMPYLSISFAIGNLVLIFMIIFIFKKNYILALIWAIVGGIILDISFGMGFGPYLASLLVVCLVFCYAYERFFQSNLFIFVLVAVLFSSIFLDILFTLMVMVMGSEIEIVFLWSIILKQAAYNTILAAIIYSVYYYFENRVYPQNKIKLPDFV